MSTLAFDEALFRAANHHHLTIIEVMVVDPGATQLPGYRYRLWCMNCDLRGGHLFTDRATAIATASSLRSTAEPPCQHGAARDKVAQ